MKNIKTSLNEFVKEDDPYGEEVDEQTR